MSEITVLMFCQKIIENYVFWRICKGSSLWNFSKYCRKWSYEGIPKALIALYLAGSPSNLDDCSFLREENCVKCTSILALELNISWN